MNRLKLRRCELGLSQWETAKAANLERWCVQLIEAGHRNPSLDERTALAEALNIDADVLFSGGKVKLKGSK